jgi:hypothetical protein
VQETDLALAVVEQSRERYPMSAIVRTLGVSSPNLIKRTTKPSKPRGPYRKADDLVPVAEPRPITDQRPIYGYRRMTALLNRQRRKEGTSAPTNHSSGRPEPKLPPLKGNLESVTRQFGHPFVNKT